MLVRSEAGLDRLDVEAEAAGSTWKKLLHENKGVVKKDCQFKLG